MSSLLVFNRVYRLEIQSVMLVFFTLFVNSRPSPLPCSNEYMGYVFIHCVKGRGGGGVGVRVVWRAYTGFIHYLFDQIPNLQNCFTTPNKNLGGGGGAADR